LIRKSSDERSWFVGIGRNDFFFLFLLLGDGLLFVLLRSAYCLDLRAMHRNSPMSCRREPFARI
jgi:hypothetical protein